MYEGAIREPLFVRWPGSIQPNSLSHALMTSPDFYPTLLELCGLPLRPQQHCDGVSLAPVWLNPEADFDRGPIFWHYPHYGNQGGTPGSALADYPQQVQQFHQLLQQWLKEVDAWYPTENPDAEADMA